MTTQQKNTFKYFSGIIAGIIGTLIINYIVISNTVSGQAVQTQNNTKAIESLQKDIDDKLSLKEFYEFRKEYREDIKDLKNQLITAKTR